ncbi:MAG: hypothetical protein IKJ77_04020 [Firmicutes bacterium]|nr:hypothetical protein [Bacillota bacterium]
MGDVRQFYFRIDAEAAERFRKFCDEEKITQAQGFDDIMRLLELNQAKAALPDYVANIEEVQLCVSKILDLYTLALGGIKMADEKAHKEYRRQLTDQSDFIETLKAEIATKDMLIASAEASKIAAEDHALAEQQKASTAQAQADAAKETAEQVKKNNEFLTSENAQLKKELKDLSALKAELTDIQMKLRLTEQQLIDAQREAEINLERSLAQLRVDYAKEFSVQERDFERKLANLEIELSKAAAISEARANQIEKIEKQHALEVEKLNDRLDGLWNKRQ